MGRRALITGITGQDGSYLAELLLEKGYEVHGVTRQLSDDKMERIRHLKDQLHFHQGNLMDQARIVGLLQEIQPHEVYNLAAQSFIPTSWSEPVLTGEITALGVTKMLEAIRNASATVRLFQASSADMFGRAQEIPQTETTPFHPLSPYGVAKVYGHLIVGTYRDALNLYAVSGILFNHESPRRGLEFVVRKVTHGAAAIKLGLQRRLHLGNLDVQRDWGYAGDYVEAMWRMLQQDQPDDYVIATGETHTLRQLCQTAFAHLDLDWQEYVHVDAALIRAAETNTPVGSYAKAKRQLGWEPKVRFQKLIEMMVDADLELLKRDKHL